MDTSLAEAQRRDAADPLAHLRARFHLPPAIYLDGNSLGLQPTTASAAVQRVLDEWRQLAIDGFMNAAPPWYTYAESLRDLLAPLVGAQPDEVIVTGTTTVNLHALLATFYRPAPGRRKIVATAADFPSDIYALQSHIRWHGGDPEADLVRVPPRAGPLLHEDDLVAAMTPDVALALLPSVLYRSGQLLDIERLAAAARRRDILFGVDAAHGVGCVPHHFDRWDLDFAVWCSYKYLNGGPASPAGLYVNRRHFQRLPGLAGWWGSDKQRQFDMAHVFTPAADAGRWQISAPPMLAMAPLEASLRTFAEVGIQAIRRGSLERSGYLMDLLDGLGLSAAPYHYAVGTPRRPERRGGHVAVHHPEAARICKALKARGVVPDFRPPDVIRLAPVALYNTFEDCWHAVRHLQAIVERREHELHPPGRGLVA